MSSVAQLPISGKPATDESVYDRLIVRMEQAQSILMLIASATDTESGNCHRPDGKHVRNAAHVADQMLTASITDIDTIYFGDVQ